MPRKLKPIETKRTASIQILVTPDLKIEIERYCLLHDVTASSLFEPLLKKAIKYREGKP